MFWYCHHLHHLQPTKTICGFVWDNKVSFGRKNHCMHFLMFFIFRIPTILNCFHEGNIFFASDNYWLGEFLGRYFVVLNSSINFIIYCLVGSQFRKVRKIFVKLPNAIIFLLVRIWWWPLLWPGANDVWLEFRHNSKSSNC